MRGQHVPKGPPSQIVPRHGDPNYPGPPFSWTPILGSSHALSPPFLGTPSPTEPPDYPIMSPACPLLCLLLSLTLPPPRATYMPAVLWDRVTLTCQGSGTAGATTWYKDGQRWGQNRRDSFTVTESGTYTCDRPGSGLSPPVIALNDRLVLQVPARTLLEGDTVTLRCRAMWDMSVDRVRFYKDKKDLRMSLRGNELSLSPLQQHHSGRYHCEGSGPFWASQSAPVTVTVHGTRGHKSPSPLLPRALHGARVPPQ
uniref:Ig-like domain-containing protein n=1 Tax=Cyanoderma ruficeps TaxID=181631 RepID=A0A8C3XBJ8_9PASS